MPTQIYTWSSWRSSLPRYVYYFTAESLTLQCVTVSAPGVHGRPRGETASPAGLDCACLGAAVPEGHGAEAGGA